MEMFVVNMDGWKNNMKTISFNGTEHLIQNYCITFSHQIGYEHSRIKNSFVVKGANVTKENALEITKAAFSPPMFTNIEIISIENDENTLTPSEYEFIKCKINDLYQSSMRLKELNIINGKSKGPLTESEHDKYLIGIVKKMADRMDQFPVYHT